MTITLRIAAPEDGAACAAIYAPWVAETAISFETEPPSAAEMTRRIEKTLPAYPWLIAEAEDGVVGYAYAGRFAERAAYRWAVEASVYVARERHRAGTGRALYGALLALLKAQGFETVWGGATLPNPASAGLHEALGFRPAGIYRRIGHKFGQWHDVGWWGLELGGAGNPPAEPVSFARLREQKGWDAPLTGAP